VRQATEPAPTPPDAEIREQPLKRDLVVVAQGQNAGPSPETASASAELEEALSAERARTAQLENERAQLQEWNARLVPGGIVLTLNDIFAFNQEEPSPDAQASLNRLAILLNERPERRILVEGHTDAAGAEEYNLALSQKRADAVRQYLQKQGVSESRIDASGVGEKSPVAPNNTAAGRRQNRRVEVRIQDPNVTAKDG
jgi:outer membrane protein OmpA-like peptidoglycan-associated protein